MLSFGDLRQLHQSVSGVIKEYSIRLAEAVTSRDSVFKGLTVTAAAPAAKREVFARPASFIRAVRVLHELQCHGSVKEFFERIGYEVSELIAVQNVKIAGEYASVGFQHKLDRTMSAHAAFLGLQSHQDRHVVFKGTVVDVCAVHKIMIPEIKQAAQKLSVLCGGEVFVFVTSKRIKTGDVLLPGHAVFFEELIDTRYGARVPAGHHRYGIVGHVVFPKKFGGVQNLLERTLSVCIGAMEIVDVTRAVDRKTYSS